MRNSKVKLIVLGAFFLPLLLMISSCNKTEEISSPKYVFLFIGDGMGPAQVTLTESYLGMVDGKESPNLLSFSEYPTQSTSTTVCENRMITGSAAAGTALATGKKTSVGTISMDENHEIAYPSIAEIAKKDGYKVGIISSVMINHATPAVFYAHQPSRGDYFEIAMSLPKSGFDFYGGGGFKHRSDTLDGKVVNAVDAAKEAGYTYVNSKNDFEKMSKNQLPILFESPVREGEKSFAMPYRCDLSETDITLPNIVEKGIQLLENEKGFFMMVEGGKIDWACHGNDAVAAISEVLDFEEAVDVAYSFYEKHPNETLIVVTADHETGGLSIGNRVNKYDLHLNLLKNQKHSIVKITQDFITLHEKQNGEITESQALDFVDSNFGLGTAISLTDEDLNTLKTAFKNSQNAADKKTLYSQTDLFLFTAMNMLNEKAGVGWSTNSHTTLPVPVYAIGAGSEMFSGYLDNTDIPKNMMMLMGEIVYLMFFGQILL